MRVRSKFLRLILFVLAAAVLLSLSSCGLIGGNEDTDSSGLKVCPECGKRAMPEDWTLTVKPTCSEFGTESRICSACGYKIDVRVKKTEHSFGEWHVDVAPTCVSDGLEKQVCAACGEYKTRILDLTGEHDYQKTKVLKEPTCKTEGKTEYECTVCHRLSYEPIAAVAHSYGEWKVTKTSDCSHKGEKERKCIWCDDIDKGEVPFDTTVHTPAGKIVGYIKEPTCIEGGTGLKKCYYCEETAEVSLKPTNIHEYVDDGVITEPTCEDDGVKRIKCIHCSDLSEELIPATGHSYGEWEVKVEPTCGQGRKERVCAVCDNVDSEVLSAVTDEHTMGEWTVETNATCGANGLKKRVCTVCGGNEETDIIPANGQHVNGSYEVVKDATCTEKGLMRSVCKVCGGNPKELDIMKKSHAYGEWEETKAPTCTAKGAKKRVCSACGEEDETDLSPTGIHIYGEWEQSDINFHIRHCNYCTQTDVERHDGGVCTVCDYAMPDVCKELIYELNADNQSYSVKGVTTNAENMLPQKVVIPDMYAGLPVTGIKSEAFMGTRTCSYLKELVLPEKLEFIESTNF